MSRATGPGFIRALLAFWMLSLSGPRSHGIGYETVGVDRGRGLSQPRNFTGYTAVDRGRGTFFPEPSALPLPVVPAKPTTTRTMTARTLISRRAPAAHRECARTLVPSARTYSLTCTTWPLPRPPGAPLAHGTHQESSHH
ncbi:hypothetical protein [Streptomyces sp. NPDC055105]|uniref:hypothetical protein n=1 Tax=Streptomyces sp. NPDC055105 TaxID=3365719 RepID=UPI0037D852A1